MLGHCLYTLATSEEGLGPLLPINSLLRFHFHLFSGQGVWCPSGTLYLTGSWHLPCVLTVLRTLSQEEREKLLRPGFGIPAPCLPSKVVSGIRRMTFCREQPSWGHEILISELGVGGAKWLSQANSQHKKTLQIRGSLLYPMFIFCTLFALLKFLQKVMPHSTLQLNTSDIVGIPKLDGDVICFKCWKVCHPTPFLLAVFCQHRHSHEGGVDPILTSLNYTRDGIEFLIKRKKSRLFFYLIKIHLSSMGAR